MKINGKKFHTGLVTLLTFLAQPSFAQEEAQEEGRQNVATERSDTFKPHVGALLGFMSPNEGVGDTSVHFGADVGFQPFNQFGLGLTVSFYNDRDEVGNTVAKTTLVPVLIETSFHFSRSSNLAVLGGFHIGTKEGLVFKSGELNGDDFNSAGFGIGPLVGYDHMLTRNFSVGGEAHYLFVLDDEDYRLLNVLGALKFWI